jgi:hypothetical protein
LLLLETVRDIDPKVLSRGRFIVRNVSGVFSPGLVLVVYPFLDAGMGLGELTPVCRWVMICLSGQNLEGCILPYVSGVVFVSLGEESKLGGHDMVNRREDIVATALVCNSSMTVTVAASLQITLNIQLQTE